MEENKVMKALKKKWYGMRARVRHNPYYTARVQCLFVSFHQFVQWSIRAGFEIGLVLDRVNPALHYSPDNCQYLTPSENAIKTGRERRRFSDDEIRLIRNQYAAGISSYKLAKRWSYSQRSIISIVHRTLYADVA